MVETITLTLAWENGRCRVIDVSAASVNGVETPIAPAKSADAVRRLSPAETQALQRTPERHTAIWLGLQRGLPPAILHRAVNTLPAPRPLSFNAFQNYVVWVQDNPPAVLEPVDESIFVIPPRAKPAQKPSQKPSPMRTPERRAKLLDMLREGKSQSVILNELNRATYPGTPVRKTALRDWIKLLREEGLASVGWDNPAQDLTPPEPPQEAAERPSGPESLPEMSAPQEAAVEAPAGDGEPLSRSGLVFRTKRRLDAVVQGVKEGLPQKVLLAQLNQLPGDQIRLGYMKKWLYELRQSGALPPVPKGSFSDRMASAKAAMSQGASQEPAPPESQPVPEAPKALPEPANEPGSPSATDPDPPFSTGQVSVENAPPPVHMPRLVPRMPDSPGVTVKYYAIGEARRWAAHWGMPGWSIATYEQINEYCRQHKKPYEFRHPTAERAA